MDITKRITKLLLKILLSSWSLVFQGFRMTNPNTKKGRRISELKIQIKNISIQHNCLILLHSYFSLCCGCAGTSAAEWWKQTEKLNISKQYTSAHNSPQVHEFANLNPKT